MELTDAVAIVTGSSSGVGAATARLLASKGARVVINYSRSADAAEAVAEECAAIGAETITCQANVADDGEP
ncbi:MAG: SDR family NAD(P)-dependent oxidoreductase [Gammaproteobacteria bacterium]|nr:SDR family NAD(P)-dependent oxidoreductase [Gammaproteobacteria bacterium]